MSGSSTNLGKQARYSVSGVNGKRSMKWQTPSATHVISNFNENGVEWIFVTASLIRIIIIFPQRNKEVKWRSD